MRVIIDSFTNILVKLFSSVTMHQFSDFEENLETNAEWGFGL